MKNPSSPTKPQAVVLNSSPKLLSEKHKWEERKSLMIEINPMVKPIFQKFDSDYFEMFSEMGTFELVQQQVSMGFSEEDVKKIFFQKNYDRILIHFFEYLFDFELQTLQFKQKYETILSFGQWIENEVVFEIPDKIRLLNKRKSQSQHCMPKQSNTSNQKQSEKLKVSSVFKRPSTDGDEEKREKQTLQIGSPNKKKVIQDEHKGIKFINPNINFLQKELEKEEKVQNPTEKYRINRNLISDDYYEKRRFLKVNEPKSSTRSGSKKSEKSNKKESSKQKPNHQFEKKVTMIKPFLQGEVIVLETSSEDKEKSVDRIAQEEKMCVNILDNLEISGLERLGSEGDRKSQVSNGKVGSIASRQDLQANEENSSRLSSRQLFQRDYIQNQNRLIRPNHLTANQIMQDIAEKQNLNSLPEAEQIKRKLHIFRAKLSGLFRYSEKRFYIFPDFSPGLQENYLLQNSRNNQEKKPKSTSKSRKRFNKPHQ